MEGIIFDLKKFRKEKMNGMSQEEFAKQIGTSHDKVSRMEADPSQISLDMLIRIATHFGMNMDEMIALPKPTAQALTVENTWSSAEFIRKTLLDYVKGQDEVLPSYAQDIRELSYLIKKTVRKPKVALIGRSDVGKSHMINTMLGAERMPAHWTPATSIAVYIKHVNDRPDFMDEDVWVFKSDTRSRESWDDALLTDEAYCRSLKLSSGNYDLLKSYGTRRGEHFAENQATAAVVFIDSDLLLNCDIIDLPGYGTGDRVEDDALSLREKNKADVLVYLSIANGFMRSEDIAYIKEAIPGLADIQEYDGMEIAPLENLFIVASQAHVVENGNQEALDVILEAGCQRLEKSLTPGIWSGRRKPESLLDRFYTYTSNKYMLRDRFEHDFCALIEKLPHVIENRSKAVIKEWVSGKEKALQNTIETYNQILEDRKKVEEALHNYEQNEPQRQSSFRKSRQKVTDKITKYKRESQNEISNFYDRTIDVDHLVYLMEQRDVENKKEDLQVFSSYVSGLLQDEMNAILKAKSKDLSADIGDFLKDFESSTNLSFNSNASFKFAPFRTEQAFAAGLSGLATYGALSVWAASCGNLGGYILVAKGVSLLSSLGISVGGTAAAISAISAIGGPIVLGIGIALGAAALAFGLLSGGWKKSAAKKFVAAYRDEGCLDKLQSSISTFWVDTQKAFNASADNLDKEWRNKIEELRNQLYQNDINATLMAKKNAEEMEVFLQNIPY